MPKGRSRNQTVLLHRWARRCVTETLESRVLLSGAHEQALINVLEAALESTSAGGLTAFNTRLTDSSALGKNLAVVGTGMDLYDPGAALGPSLTQIGGSYATLASLAAALGTGTGVTVSATRDLANDVQIDVAFNVTSNISVPLNGSFGVSFSMPGNLTMSVNLQESLTIGAYWDSHTSAAVAYVNAAGTSIQVTGTTTGFVFTPWTQSGPEPQLGFLEFDSPVTPFSPADEQNPTGNKILSAAISYSPTFNFTLNTQPPVDSSEASGRLTLGQLNSVDVGNLVATQVTQPAPATVTVNLTTPLAPSASQIVFTWPDINSPTNVSSTLTSDSTLTSLDQLQSINPETISLGLDEVTADLTAAATNSSSSNPFDIDLPLINQSVNDLVNFLTPATSTSALTTFYSTYLTNFTDVAGSGTNVGIAPFASDDALWTIIQGIGKNFPKPSQSQPTLPLVNVSITGESASGSQLMFGINLDVSYTAPITPVLNVNPALNLAGLPSLSITTIVATSFTFGVDGSTGTFFVKSGGGAQVGIDGSATDTVPAGSKPGAYVYYGKLGFLGIDLSGTSLQFAANGAITLVDPQTDNPATPGILTANELTSGMQSNGTNIAVPATVTLAGTASATIDIGPDLTTYGPNTSLVIDPNLPNATITIAWPDVTTPSNYTFNSTNLNEYLGFNNITSSSIGTAITELPTLLNTLSDSSQWGRDLAFFGPSLGATVTLGSTFTTDLTTGGITSAGVYNFQTLVTDLNTAFGLGNVYFNTTSDGLYLSIKVTQPTYNGNVNWQVSEPVDGVAVTASGKAAVTANYTATIDLGIVLNSTATPDDQFYILGGPGGSTFSGSLLVNAYGLSGAATVGNLSVNYSGGTATVGETDGQGNVEVGTPGTFSLALGNSTAGDRLVLPQTLVKPDSYFGAATFQTAAKLVLPLSGLPDPGTSPSVQFTWSNLGETSSVLSTANNLGDLSTAKTFATSPIMQGFNSLLSLITQWEDASELNTDIPFVDKTISQLVNFSGDTTSAFTTIENAIKSATTAAQLDGAIKAALPAGEITATSNDNPSANQFEYTLAINESPSQTLPFSLGAGEGSLFSLTASLSVNASFIANIVFGFDAADGFYIVGGSDPSSPQVSLSASISANFPQFSIGNFGILSFGLSNGSATASLGLGLNLTPPGDDGDKISAVDLASDGLSIIQANVTGGTGQLSLDIGLHLGSGGPGITTTFSAAWDPTQSDSLTFGPDGSTDPTDGFGPFNFDLGEFVDDLVGPVITYIKQYDPLPPDLINALNYKIPIIDETPIQILADQVGSPNIALLFQIADVVTDLANLPTGDQLDLSQYIPGATGTPGDTGTPDGTAPNAIVANGATPADSLSDLYSQFSTFTTMLQNDFDISLPFLQNPQQSLIDTLMGKDVDLITFDPGKIQLSEGYDTPAIMIPLFSIGIASADAFFQAGISVSLFGNIDIGLSTRGLLGQGIGGGSNIQDGFYIGDADQFTFGAEIEGHVTIGGSIDLLNFISIAKIDGQLGPYGEVGARVNSLVPNDSGSYETNGAGLYEIAGYDGAPAGTGRAYLDEIEYIANTYGPLCAVMPEGQIGLQLVVNAEVNLLITSFSVNLLTEQFPIANFDYPCEPQLASLGYISGNQLIMYQNPTANGSPIDPTAGYNISAAIEYDNTTGLPAGIALVESNSSNIYYQDFPLSDLALVNTLLMEGSNGNDTFSFDPNLSLASVLASPIQYLSIDTNGGNDTVDLSELTEKPAGNSDLLGVTISGGDGNDTLKGTYAPDVINVGGGTNYVFTGTSTSVVNETSGTDKINGADGDTTVNAGSGPETIILGNGNDIIYAGGGSESIGLGDGQDLITAGSGHDTILVGNGNDTIYGDTGGSTINTGAGQDIIYGGAGNDSITADGGNDFIDPGTGNDVVDGGSGHTVLAIHADTNQTLTNTSVSLGSDGKIKFTNIASISLTGGPGNNIFDVSAWTGSPVQINGDGGSDTIAATDDTSFTLTDSSLSRSDGAVFSLTGISNADLTNGASDNSFDVTGWTGSGTLTGNGGVDTLIAGNVQGSTLSDSLLTRSGDGNLTLSGIVQADLTTYTGGNVGINAAAFDGAVALFAEGNNNTLIGGSGSDYLDAGSGSNNTLIAHGTSDNQVLGDGGSNDNLQGGPGENLIVGSDDGGDTITTGSGESHVYTPRTIETINAQSGNAIVYADNTSDSVNVGSSTTDQVMHPGDAGTQASDFIAPTDGDPWAFPIIPAVQSSTLPTGPNSQGQWIQYAESASGEGVSNSTGAAIEPSVVVDSSDDEFIAWADNRTGVDQIYVAEHTASGWQEMDESAQGGGISNAGVNSTQPSITLNAAGQPEVVWMETNGSSSDIYGAYFNATANGGAGVWQALGSSLSAGGISNTGAADAPQIVNTTAGPVVAWLNSSGGATNVFARQFNGTTWATLGTNSASGYGISNQDATTPSFSLATDGTKIAIGWTEIGTSPGNSIYLLQYSGGTWNAVNGSDSGTGISGSSSAAEPSVAYAGGSLYAAWAANTDGTNNIVAAGNSGTGWNAISIETPSSAGINQVSRGAASDPVLSSNGSNLDLVWLEDRLPSTPDEAIAIYANRLVSGSFVYQLPGDSSFDGILGRSTSLSTPVTLALAVDSSGHPFVAWGDDSSGSSQIYSLADTLNVNKIIYVNDSLTVTDFYTTQGGVDSNNGLSPSTPVATVAEGLTLATQAGDVILVDGGSYAGFSVTSANDGVLILGSPAGNTQITGTVSISNANNVGLSLLELSGGVNISGGSGVDLTSDIGDTPQQIADDQGGAITINGTTNALLLDDAFATVTLSGSTSGTTILDSDILGAGLTVSSPATSLVVEGNTLSSLTLNAVSQGIISDNNIDKNGLTIGASFTGSIDHNLIHNAKVGVTYSASAPLNDNEIFNNKTGVVDTVNSSTTGLGFVAGSLPNFIFSNGIGVNLTGLMQDQSITGNNTGAIGSGTLGGTSLDTANLIQNNTTGVKFTGTIQYNDIARNETSIVVQNNQLVIHNNIYDDNGAPNLETNGAIDVEIINDTFYSPNETNIEIDGGSSDVDVLNDILWTAGGYDIDVANDSRVGFFSDYNDLYTTGSGLIVHYLEDFSDVLDWQDDVDLYDLHSIGTTVVNPTEAQPQFVDLALNDFAVYPAAAGIRDTSPTMGTGDPGTDLGLPASEQNLLTNPSFESGLTGWTVNPGSSTQSGGPGAFDGTNYFYAGSVATGYAQQTINLIGDGYTAAQIDAGTLDISFGGRIRSANETPADQGEIVLTFLDASNNVIGTSTVLSALNVDDRWQLVSGRVHIPEGARSVTYSYQSTRETGSTDDSYLDAAFLRVLANTVSTDMGAFGNTVASLTVPVDESIHLESPDLYVNWTLNQAHLITWATFGNTGDSAVKIDLYQRVAGVLTFLKTITASTPDDGSYSWIPANSGLTYGTSGLVIEVSLVGNPAIHDKSTETFTIPSNGTTFYVNDGSTTGDQYTTAAGNNRATGLSPSDPLPLLTTLFRTYSLGATDTVYVDNGTYEDFAPIEISGNPAVGSGQGITILGPTNSGTQAQITALGFTAPAVIDVNDATYVTLKNLDLTGGNYGVWIHNDSPNFVGSYLTATSNLLGGIRIESDSTNATFDHLNTSNNTGDGFYAGGSFVSLTHSISSGNTGDGFDLANSGAAVLTDDIGDYNTSDGISVIDSVSGTTTMVGNANLSLGLGNQFYNNGSIGIYAQSYVDVAGNVVYNQTATNAYGIDLLSAYGLITENVVYNNYNGIYANGGQLTYNTSYNNANIGIEGDGGATITGNTVYGNFIGIKSISAPNSVTGPYILNNLVYNNNAPYPLLASLQKGAIAPLPTGIILAGGNAAQINNNTVYQPSGDALDIDAYGGGVLASNIQVEDNIFWTLAGNDISVDPTSESGFHSDYNDLYFTASGNAGLWENMVQNNLAAWNTASNGDADSISVNPLFVNIAGADFHVQSTTGSYHGGSLSPILSGGSAVANPGTLTADANESPTIDRGDASFSYANEPTPNGGFINIGSFGNTAQASLSPTSYILVLKPGSGQTLIDGQAFTITWRSQDTNGTVNIDLLYDGSEYLNIATGISNSGTYSWTPSGSVTPNSGYTIQVTRNASPTAVGDSTSFSIEGTITKYYVNGSSSAGVFTTAGGSDSNSGLDPAHPKATIQALLSAYQLGAGDTIYVDEGTYNLTNNIVLTAANDGLTIDGVGNNQTILDRANTATGSYDIDLQATANITLENLSFTGGYYGVNVAYTTASNYGLTIQNDDFYGSVQIGLFLVNNYTNTDIQTGDVITSNTFHDMTSSDSSNYYYGLGLQAQGDQLTITNNIFYNLGQGLDIAGGDGSTISGNTAYSTTTGFDLDTSIVTGNIAYGSTIGFTITGSSTATGNTAYNNTSLGFNVSAGTVTGNIAYSNAVGIQINGNSTISDNLVYNNTTAGISGGNGDNIIGNVAYGNGIGISISSAGNAADGGPTIENNLIYNNKTAGISEVGGDHTPILNNTVYQTTGDALDISGSNITDVEVRDNIFYVTSGLDITVASASEQSVTIDYNDLYATGSGQIGQWNGVNYATLATWQNASGMDPDSISADPLFENIATSDFHVQSQYGANHGGTLAPILGGNGLPVANPGTLSDDSSTSPTIDRGAPTDLYAVEPAANGGYVNLGSYGNTSQASLSPAHYLLVINPLAGVTIAAGQPSKIVWRDEVTNLAAGASDTDTIKLVQGGNIISTFSAPDTGTYTWTPSTSIASGQYQIEIIRNDSTALSATSGIFNIAAFNGIYYVNSSSSAGTFTTAAGSDSNSGLDPAHPKATIGAILSSYVLQPGNIIMVDQGTYNLTTNLTLTAADDGITIEGVPNQTILTRNNVSSGTSFDFDFQGALNVTLENLNITGAFYGINANYGALATGLTVTGSNFYGDENAGIDLGGQNGSATITNNTFHSLLGSSTYGFESYTGTVVTVTGNIAYGMADGISVSTSGSSTVTSTISNNTVYDNSTGIYANNGDTSAAFNVNNNTAYDNYSINLNLGGAGLVATGNTVYEDGGAGKNESSGEVGALIAGSTFNNNTVYGNVTGISMGSSQFGNAFATGNIVRNNTGDGITVSDGDTISGNTVYSNGGWGIQASLGYGSYTTIANNLVYSNTTGGIYVSNAYLDTVLNNTVYQTTGDALKVDGLLTTSNGTQIGLNVQNNILWTQGANSYDLDISDSAEPNFASDYNDLYTTGSGQIAQMSGQSFATLSAWAWELGLDTHSISVDPQFVTVAGGNFHVQSTSPSIDAGNPASEFILEPQPNGGRINLGYDGDTTQAAASSATSIQVTSPSSLQRLQVGQSTTIQFQTTGLLATQTLTEVATGVSSQVGEYHAAEFAVGSPTTSDVSSTTVINTSLVSNPAPQSVYQNWAQAPSGIGNTLAYSIPIPDGTYTIRLDFSEPYYSSGSRIFDILLNGTTVQSTFDIAATAGNTDNKAVAETFTVTASGGTGISLVLKNDTGNPAILSGFQIAQPNANGTAGQTANIQVSTDNGNSWSTIATNQPVDSEGRGSFAWSPTTSSTTALLRVIANNSANTTGTSSLFEIAPGGLIYYVNDSSTTGDSLTTAVGNNANDGKTPATPMASIEAVLNTYQPSAGATIEVDNGTYTLFHDIFIPAIDSGITITGPTTGAAVINRNNLSAGDYVFDLFTNANNVTIEHLSITGGNTGIEGSNSGNTNITIADNAIYANNGNGYSGGIQSSSAINWLVTGNTVHDNTGFYGGIYFTYSTATITNNISYNERYGIFLSTVSGAVVANNIVSGNLAYGNTDGIYVDQATVENNVVHDNSSLGIYADSLSIISGNTAYRQTTSGAYGIEFANATVFNNTVYDNYIGMYVNGGSGAHVYDNRIYSNLDDGLSISSINGSNYSIGYNYVATIYDNLIYANDETGIYLTGNYDLSVVNNTVYQLAGDAIEINSASTTYPSTVENNILWVQAGYDLRLDSGVSAASLISDYNDLYHIGNNANVATLSGIAYNTLAAWHTASGEDAHSTEANPMFVDPTGADAVLGYNATANNNAGYNGGPDDNFFLTVGSPAIATGNSAFEPATDALGYPRTYADIGAYAYRGSAASSTPATVVSAVTGSGSSGIGIANITVAFSQPVNDIDANAPSLYSLLSAGPDGVFGTGDDIVYSLTPTYTAGSNQVLLTANAGSLPAGHYQLTIFSNAASSIHNLSGLELDGDANGTPGGNYVTTFTATSSILGRDIFYNDSSFDGNNVAANAADENAIATDKQALLPGQTATFVNYTSFTDGINGIMVDIGSLPTFGLTASDFTFLVGNSSDMTTWTTAPAPQSITVRSGAGADGSSRVEIIWANDAIKDEWVQVTVLADADTGLAQPDVFYFGNAIGESGNSSTDAAVTTADALAARGRISPNAVSVTSPYDYNRDGIINAADVAAAQQNLTSGTAVLQLISVPNVSAPVVVVVSDPGSSGPTSSDPGLSDPTTPPATDTSDPTQSTGTGDDNSTTTPPATDGSSDPTQSTSGGTDTSATTGDTSGTGSQQSTGSDNSSTNPTDGTSNTTTPTDGSGDNTTDPTDPTDPTGGSSNTGAPVVTPIVTPVVTPVVITDPVEGLHLVFVTIPTTGIAGKNLKSKIVVYAEDAAGHLIKEANTLVTLSIPDATLAGKTSHKLKHGKAVFSGLAIEEAGTWTISATDDIYTTAVSGSITVTAPPQHKIAAATRRHHA